MLYIFKKSLCKKCENIVFAYVIKCESKDYLVKCGWCIFEENLEFGHDFEIKLHLLPWS